MAEQPAFETSSQTHPTALRNDMIPGHVSASNEKTSYAYRTGDVVLAWLCWLAGYLFCVVVPITKCLLGAFLFELVMFGGALWLLAVRNHSCILRGLVQALVSVLLALSFLVTTNTAIIVCVFLFDCVSWFYMVFVLSGASRERFPGSYLAKEISTSVFYTPFKAPGNLFSAIFGGQRINSQGKRSGRFGRTFGFVLLGLGLAILPTLAVGLLLSYDERFTHLMDQLFDLSVIAKTIRNLLLGIVIGALAFGAILASLHRTQVRRENADGTATPVDQRQGTHFLPVTVVCAALTPVLVLYIIFFVSQWSYYVSAFTGLRPEKLTFSDYARQGFFELCAVAGINAVLGICACAFSKRRDINSDQPARDRAYPALRVLLGFLSAFTLVLIATALSKMFLYVDTYGLTHKRVYATWLMLLLAVSFIAVLIRQLWRRMNLTGTLLCIFLAFFLAVSLVNVDSLIVSYNVNACLDGNVRAMQGEKGGEGYIEVLEDAGISGVVPALDFMHQTEGTADSELIAIREQTDQYLKRMAYKLHDMKAGEKNVVSIRAEKALQHDMQYALNQ